MLEVDQLQTGNDRHHVDRQPELLLLLSGDVDRLAVVQPRVPLLRRKKGQFDLVGNLCTIEVLNLVAPSLVNHYGGAQLGAA